MNYLEITTNGTNQVKKSAGYFQGYTVNKNAAGTVIISDNNGEAGTPSISIAGGGGAVPIPTVAGSFVDYDLHFSNGLKIVTAGLAAGESITVEFY